MAPTMATNKSSLPPPPCSSFSSSSDVVRQLVMGRWRSSLSSGLRAALACTIVGLFSLYAPSPLRRHITFPAFSYVVTVITIAPDATLGTALRGAVSAVHGTLMGAMPSVAALWLAHRTGANMESSVAATSAVVALTAFAVALPEEEAVGGPLAKRVALGQAIIIYVARFGQHQQQALLLHPANVVACTALGVAAALLAVLLPWPRLAAREAGVKSRVAFKVVAAERVRVLADAFVINGVMGSDSEACSRQRRWQMAVCMSEANRLASASTTLVNRINALKEDLQWERALGVAVVEDNKQNKQSSIEMALTGMQIALATMQQQDDGGHGRNNNNMENMVGLVMAMRDQIRLALLAPNNQGRSLLFGSSCSTATTATPSNKSRCNLPTPTNYDYHEAGQQQLAPLLFMFSLYQLHRRCCCGAGPDEMPLTAAAASIPNAKQVVAPATTTTTGPELLLEQPTADSLPDDEEEQEVDQQQQVGQDDDDPSPHQAQTATVTAGEEKEKATTTAVSAGCCISWWPRRRRLLAAAKCGFSLGLAVLLGLLFSSDHGFWSGLIVATTMTAGRESTWAVAVARAHGTALGSIYGVLGCLLMSRQERLLTMDLRILALQLPWMMVAAFLKRSRTYGPAGGVAAALSVVIIMGRRYDEAPMAFTMARLVETFIGISCAVMADLVFQPGARPTVQAREQLNRCIAALADCCAEASSDSELKRVQQELVLLRKRAAEAGSEPTYLWLPPPFPAACYGKIQGSLARMAQLLQLYHQARRCMSVDNNSNIIQQQRFSSLASNSLSHCLHMLAPPGKEPQKPKGQVLDLEAGGVGCSSCCCYKDDESFRAQAGEAKLLLLNDDDDDSVRQQEERFLVVCCLGSIALCMGEILKEAQRLEAHILDLNLQLSTH